MSKTAIQIKGLKKSYNNTPALKGVDIEISKGEFFGLLGPNGAGKTTTINILTGLVFKDAGTCLVFEKDIVKDYRYTRSKIGIAAQELSVDWFFTIEKLLYFQAGYYGISTQKAKSKVDELLERLGLDKKRDSRLRQLSGGMKRRFQIAKALVHDPDILILDEPTAGVDIELRVQLWEYVRKLNENGTTIILTTHYLEEAEELCDKVAILDKGKIVKSASKQDLLEDAESKTISVKVKETPDLNHPILLELGANINDKNELTVNFNPKIINSREVLSKIEEAGVMPFDFDVTGASLETVFLSITQKK